MGSPLSVTENTILSSGPHALVDRTHLGVTTMASDGSTPSAMGATTTSHTMVVPSRTGTS